MKAVDVYCKCENRNFTERMQGLLINDHHVLVVSDTGLTVWTYQNESGEIVVDGDRDRIILSMDLTDLDLPENLEATVFARMTFQDFVQYLLAWDGGEAPATVQPGDYIYQPSGGYIRKASYVYPNGTVTSDTGELMARSEYQTLNEEETQLVNKLSKSLRDNRSIAEGYEVGKLAANDEGVQLGKFILQSYDMIEVFIGEEIKRITYDEACEYDGYEARFLPIKLSVLTEEDFKR